jgi:tetratricopeptide (TPR) repeat protein
VLRGSRAHRTRLAWPALALLSALPAPAAWASSADGETSQEHFDKGVAATDAGRFEEAADEFRRAYRQSEAFLILYNIGQVEALRGRPVEAVEAFERYLAEGGAEIPARRRQSVRGEIEAQGARIGTIDVRTAPPGAEVLVDGVSVGRTPFAKPVRVVAGRHQVEANLPGHAVEARALEVVGRSDVSLQLSLAPLTAVELERHFVDPALAAQTTRPLELESTGAVRPLRIAGYLLVVAGVATATAGGLVAYSGARLANEANKELAAAPTPAAWDRAKVDFDDGKARNTKGWVIAGVGGALLVGGAFILIAVPQRSGLALGAWTMADAGGVRLGGVW